MVDNPAIRRQTFATVCTKICFLAIVIDIWNSLPAHCVNCCTMNMFKKYRTGIGNCKVKVCYVDSRRYMAKGCAYSCHHSVCDNVYCSLTMFSALAAVCTVDCAIEIVLITLHYITSVTRH